MFCTALLQLLPGSCFWLLDHNKQCIKVNTVKIVERIRVCRSETCKSSLSRAPHSSLVNGTVPRGYAHEDETIRRQETDLALRSLTP